MGHSKLMSLVVANHKGGVGKTTCAVHLTRWFAEHGVCTALIDADPQGNASSSLEGAQVLGATDELFGADPLVVPEPTQTLCVFTARRRELISTGESLGPDEAATNFSSALRTIEEAGVQLVIVDTGPSLSIQLAAALLSCDRVIAPIEMEEYSIAGVSVLGDTVAAARRRNRRLALIGLVPSRVATVRKSHRDRLAELHAKFTDLVLPPLAVRDATAETLVTGVPLSEMRNSAARAAALEIHELGSAVAARMGMAVTA